MDISVVVPAFNAQATIRSCLESIRAQTLSSSYEIIVVDDGSRDATAAVVAEVDDVVLLTRPNGGPSAARNTGVSAAKGEVITFLDADDTMTENGLSARLEALRGRDALIMTSEAGRSRHEGARRIKLRELAFELGGIRGPSGWVLRRDVFLAVGGFDPHLRALEDIHFTMRALSQNLVVEVVDTPTYHYARSGSGSAALGDSLVYLARQALDDSRPFNLPEQDRRTLARQYLGYAASVYALRRDYDGIRHVRDFSRIARVNLSMPLAATYFPRLSVAVQEYRHRSSRPGLDTAGHGWPSTALQK